MIENDVKGNDVASLVLRHASYAMQRQHCHVQACT